MRNYGNNDRGGRRSFGDRGGFGRKSFDRGGDRDRGPRKMYKAVCSNCGKDCEVPFQPTSSKPVYCSDCFEKLGGSRDGRRGDRPADRPRFGDRRPSGGGDGGQNKALLESINVKLDRIIKLLEPKTVLLETKSAPTKTPEQGNMKKVNVEIHNGEKDTTPKEPIKAKKVTKKSTKAKVESKE